MAGSFLSALARAFLWHAANGTAPCHHGVGNGQRREYKKYRALIVERIGGAGVRVPLVHGLLAPRECGRF
jgi:hypothetical protein